MESYLENAPCVFLVFDDRGQLSAANQTACGLTGWQREEILQKKFSDVVTLGSRIFAQTHLFPLLQLHGHCEEIFIVMQSRTGEEIPLMLNAKRAGERNEYAMIGIPIYNRNKYEAEIIAARKYAEKALAENKELQQAKEQLQQRTAELDAQLLRLQQQNENLNQLNWTLTHTMQEPLRKIAIFSSTLLHQNLNPKTNTWAKKINSLALQAREIFIRLQQFLQLGTAALQLRPVDLQTLIAEVAETFIAKGNSVVVQMQNTAFVYGSEKELRYLFQELLQNAVQFCQPGSVATVAVEAVTVQANAFRMLKEKYAYTRYLRVSVSDKGMGFPSAQREEIFRLFNQLQKKSQGMGIGLAFCRRIMELHQGFISAESQEGKGTVVNCYFPLRNDKAGEAL